MEWAKIRSLVQTVAELARLLPEDSESRLAVLDGEHYWEDIIRIIETEMAREESWGNIEELHWERLRDLLSQVLTLPQYWKTLIFPDSALVPLPDQCTLTRMYHLRRRRSFDLA